MTTRRRMTAQTRLAVLATCAVLAACGSSVKLDETPAQAQTTAATPQPTQTLTPAPTPPATGGAQSGAATNRDVQSVQVDPSANASAGPPNAGKVIYFDYDSFAIKPEFQTVIDAHARYMAANPNRRMAIEGHTDERGGREYNLALGQKRSEAVQSALRLLGVKDNQAEPVSFGKEKPATSGGSEEAWSRNRRAEIVYR
jgi:peptidoglycan-associated lipoprotein